MHLGPNNSKEMRKHKVLSYKLKKQNCTEKAKTCLVHHFMLLSYLKGLLHHFLMQYLKLLEKRNCTISRCYCKCLCIISIFNK